MSSMYECDDEGCTWRNPAWRYGFAEAGAEWASHMTEHQPVRPDSGVV